MIKCSWLENHKKILVNIDGQVYPCCYLVNANFTHNFLDDGEVSKTGVGNIPKDNQEIMNKYNDVRDEMNVFYQPMSDIMKHSWWKELEDSWKDPNKTLRQCTAWCTVKKKEDNDE